MPSPQLAVALATLGLLAGNGCGPTAQVSPATQDAAEVTPEQQSHTRLAASDQSGFQEPAELVLRDQASFAEAWARVHAMLVPAPPPPRVDFTRQMVVVLAIGTRSSGGHAVRFDGMDREGDGARVRYTVSEPGPDCMTTQAITAPVELVGVPRVDGPVRFERRQAIAPC
jgi:hypothetical protein